MIYFSVCVFLIIIIVRNWLFFIEVANFVLAGRSYSSFIPDAKNNFDFFFSVSHECPVPRIAIEQRFSFCLRLQSKTNFCTKDKIDQKHGPLVLENAPTFSERYGPMLISTPRKAVFSYCSPEHAMARLCRRDAKRTSRPRKRRL